jgi:hypothetical protein
MKVQIVKKAVKNAKPQGYCAMFVDDFPLSKR